MANVFGRSWTKAELLARVEDMTQLAGVRRSELTDGRERGTEALEVWNSSGLAITLLPGRGLDIAHASYNGIPLCFRGGSGDVAPTFYEPEGFGWMRGFFGGLLTTCGLTFVGDPETDMSEERVPLGCHGRASYIPAHGVSISTEWETDDYVIRIRGYLREWETTGTKLELEREVVMRLGEPRISIRDRVANMSSYKTSPLMVVYHCNLGFPLLAEASRLIFQSDWTVDGAGNRVSSDIYSSISAPVLPPADAIFVHDLVPDATGQVRLALVNDALMGGLGIYWQYSKGDLPILNQWNHFVEGEYVLGLEPGTCTVFGRDANRKAGTLQHLAPREQREFNLEIGVVAGRGSVLAMEKRTMGSTQGSSGLVSSRDK
jgi:hypothetical protein